MTAVAMFVVFIGLLLVGVPVSMTIAMGVVVGIVVGGWSSDFYILPQQLLEGIDNPSLLAIPFFILAGNLLNVSGLTERIMASQSRSLSLPSRTRPSQRPGIDDLLGNIGFRSS